LDTIAGYLKERKSAIKVQAIMALGALEEKAEPYVGEICDLLKKDPDMSVRQAAAQALGNMKNKGSKVIDALISLTEEDDRKSVGAIFVACNSLMLLGANDPQTLQALDKVLEHKSMEKWEKDVVRQVIEEMKNPKRKIKAGQKAPEKQVGKQQQPNKR
jgi:HEAT repeat protein